MFVPNFKILGAVLPEKSLMEKKVYTQTDTQTDIVMEIKAPQAQYPTTAIICLCIKVIVVKMSGKKMTEGQITILNQILIISMDR